MLGALEYRCRSYAPYEEFGDCRSARGIHAAESLGGTTTTAKRHEILSEFAHWSFTFMVPIGVVARFLETCVAFIIP